MKVLKILKGAEDFGFSAKQIIRGLRRTKYETA